MPGNEANGARRTDPPAPCYEEDAEAAIGPLLARAHLLRLRGQWDEAVAAGEEALRKVRESPTACSLLGDIYEAQGKLEDALQWYGMAVEFDGSNKADRDKLERVVQMQRRALLQEEKEREARAPQGAAKRPDPANRTLEWFDRLFPPGKGEGVARLILAAGGAIFLLLTFAAAFVYFDREGSELGGPGGFMGPPASPDTVVVQPPPGAEAPPPRTPPRPETGAPTAPEPGPSPRSEPPLPAPAPGDHALREALARALPPHITVTAARVDPASARVIIAVTVPAPVAASGGSQTPAATRSGVLPAAALAARAPAPAPPPPDQVGVRVFFRPAVRTAAGRGAARPVAAPQLVFSGDTASTAVRAADPTATPAEDLRRLFADAWWLPALDPGDTPA